MVLSSSSSLGTFWREWPRLRTSFCPLTTTTMGLGTSQTMGAIKNFETTPRVLKGWTKQVMRRGWDSRRYAELLRWVYHADAPSTKTGSSTAQKEGRSLTNIQTSAPNSLSISQLDFEFASNQCVRNNQTSPLFLSFLPSTLDPCWSTVTDMSHVVVGRVEWSGFHSYFDALHTMHGPGGK